LLYLKKLDKRCELAFKTPMIKSVNNERKGWARLPFSGVVVRIIKYFGWELLLGLFLAIGLTMIFLWLADEVFEGDTKIFDENIRNAIHSISGPALTQFMLLASFVGSFYILFPASCVTAAAFAYVKWKRALVLFLFTMIGEQILEPVLKAFYHRARPEAFFDYPLPASYSFPSGHALAALCFFGILAWLIAARLENIPLRILIWLLAALTILSIGVSRVYLGVHYPSDVIAGYLSAFIWVLTIACGDFWFSRRKIRSNSKTLV
jgi:undecaprenyl-diphosphatase